MHCISRKYLDTSLPSEYLLTGTAIALAATATGIALFILKGSLPMSMPLLIGGGGFAAIQIFYIFCKKTGVFTGICHKPPLKTNQWLKRGDKAPNAYLEPPVKKAPRELLTGEAIWKASERNGLANVLSPIIDRWENRDNQDPNQHWSSNDLCHLLGLEGSGLNTLMEMGLPNPSNPMSVEACEQLFRKIRKLCKLPLSSTDLSRIKQAEKAEVLPYLVNGLISTWRSRKDDSLNLHWRISELCDLLKINKCAFIYLTKSNQNYYSVSECDTLMSNLEESANASSFILTIDHFNHYDNKDRMLKFVRNSLIAQWDNWLNNYSGNWFSRNKLVWYRHELCTLLHIDDQVLEFLCDKDTQNDLRGKDKLTYEEVQNIMYAIEFPNEPRTP